MLEAFLDHRNLAGRWRVGRSLVAPAVGAPWSVAWDSYGEQRSSHWWAGVLAELGDGHLRIDPKPSSRGLDTSIHINER